MLRQLEALCQGRKQRGLAVDAGEIGRMKTQLRRRSGRSECLGVTAQRVDTRNFQIVEIGQIHVRIFRNDW